jgi:hypothetical protein
MPCQNIPGHYPTASTSQSCLGCTFCDTRGSHKSINSKLVKQCNLVCIFCDTRGSHQTKDCRLMKQAKEMHTKRQQKGANSRLEEFAGNATSLSTPSISGPDCWIADTGATSHMTPNREWFKEYKPCQVPVRLADHNVIYAAGVGTIVFTPVKKGVSLRPIEFTNVLHVPLLRNNLLSVLTLTRKHNFEVLIKKSMMSFKLNAQILFVALVSDDNSARLEGFTTVQSALRASSPSPELWHRRFCHIGRSRLKELVSGTYVKDLNINTHPTSPFPDICKHCLAGKQHRFPFPDSASNR